MNINLLHLIFFVSAATRLAFGKGSMKCDPNQ